MPPIPDTLQTWFTRFWEFAERGTAEGRLASKPLLRMRENWSYWQHTQLARVEQQELEMLIASMAVAEQKSFVEWVEERIRERYSRRGAARLALMQLTHIPLFRHWASLDPFRIENLQGVNAIILQRRGEGRRDDINPLAVMLVPQEADDSYYELLNLKASDAALENVRCAVLSLLSGFGLLLLTFWGLAGWKPRHRLMRMLRFIGWAMVVAILTVLLAPIEIADDNLAPMLWALIVVTSALVLHSFLSNSLEMLQAREKAVLLRQSQLCVLVGGVEDRKLLEVEGPSFGVALCLAILLALYEEAESDNSWLHWLFKRMTTSLPAWSFTGEAQRNGWIKEVQRLSHKIAASRDHPAITDFMMPVQGCDHDSSASTAQPVMASPGCAGQAAGDSILRMHRRRHMAQVILTAANVVSLRGLLVNIILILSLAMVCVALPDIYRILRPPALKVVGENEQQQPVFLADSRKSGLPGGRVRMELYFITDKPDAFFVDLNSAYYCNRRVNLARDGERGRDYAVAAIYLDRHPKADDSSRDEIVVRSPRKLLFRMLPERVVCRFSLR